MARKIQAAFLYGVNIPGGVRLLPDRVRSAVQRVSSDTKLGDATRTPSPQPSPWKGEGVARMSFEHGDIEDYVSLEGARRDYGVVIDPATQTVDETATRVARAAMAKPDPLPA